MVFWCKVRKSSIVVHGLITLPLLCWLVSLIFLIRMHMLVQHSPRYVTSSAVTSLSLGKSNVDDGKLDRLDVPSDPHRRMPHVSYIKLPGVDSVGNDMFLVHGASLSRLKAICSSMEDCAGFNSDGWMKAHIVEKKRSSLDLYLKHVTAAAPPWVELGVGQSSARNRVAGVFVDHMTEYSLMEDELRIYVYETDMDKQHPSSSDHTYEVEDTFIHLLAKSKFRTKVSNEATFFLLPSCCSAYRKSVPHLQLNIDKAAQITRHMLQQIKHGFPFWNQTLGTDHLYICAHDFGTEVAKLADLELWKNAIGLVDTAKYSEFFFVPHKDISVPPNPGRKTVDWSSVGQGAVNLDPQRRSTLAFMSSQADRGPVQSLIEQYFGLDKDFYLIKGHLEEKAYIRTLMTSKFCLCPRGEKGWSLGVMDALWFGCVPVFLADHYYPPLNGLIHWDDISITIPEYQVKSLKTILQNISAHKLADMQGHIAQVYHHLTWHDPPRPFDAFHAVLFQLWQSRHIPRTKILPLPAIINS